MTLALLEKKNKVRKMMRMRKNQTKFIVLHNPSLCCKPIVKPNKTIDESETLFYKFSNVYNCSPNNPRNESDILISKKTKIYNCNNQS